MKGTGMRKQIIWGIGFILCTAAFCTACGKSQKISIQDPYTIGVVTKSSTSYWMSLCEGVKEAADQYNMNVIILQPDSETNKEAQIKMMETLAKKKVDMIAVSPVDSHSASEYLEAAQEHDIPVISYDDGFDNWEIPYIGIDNEKAGYELMKYLAEQMNHQGEAGIICGHLSQRCHRLRLEGAKRYLAKEPDMTLAYVESGYSNLQLKEEVIDRLRQEHPNVKGVMVTSAATAMGVVEAVADEDIRIVSVDAQTDALDALKEGRITALTAQSGYQTGYETVCYISELKNGKTEEKQKLLDAQLLTQENVEAYMKEKNQKEQQK